MNAQPQKERRPLVPLFLLHLAAAGVCFAFFTVVPIVGCLVLMAIGNDPGGPMFFPIFVLGVLLFAVVITGILAGAAILSDLLRRHYRVPVWLPPVVVFLLATVITWVSFSGAHPAVAPIAGGIVALAFIIHWAAISTVWFLPRLLFRLFEFRMHNQRANQACERTGSSAGEFRCFFLIRAANAMTSFSDAVDRTRKWFFLEAIVPAALVCSLYWPLGAFVKAMPYPFEQVFAGSDLLTLCGLLLFGLWIDIESLRDKALPHRFWMENIRHIALTAAILFLVFYGFLKLRFLTYSVPATGTPIDTDITSIARFTVAATLFTVTFSLVARLFTVFVFHRKEKKSP